MREGTIFPREEKTEVLFQKILNDPWACEKLQETFCNYLFCDDEINSYLSPLEFSQALFNAYHNRDLSAFLMAICENTIFDIYNIDDFNNLLKRETVYEKWHNSS